MQRQFTDWVVQAQDKEAAFKQELAKGWAMLREGRYKDALEAFKRANSFSKRDSPECLWGIAQAYQRLGEYEKTVDTCSRILRNSSDIKELGGIYNLKGVALLATARQKDDKRQKEAEEQFRKALELTDDPTVRFNLGFVLLKQGRDPEGIEELKAYLRRAGQGPAADRARKLIANPRRARENFAPDFALKSEQGERLVLEELRGKVVLVDFWGTWCAPCRESVPVLAQLFKRYSKEPFVIISIGSRDKEQDWRQFIERNKMIWPQYLDGDQQLQRTFEVNTYPTYVLIDHEGIIRYRVSGWGLFHGGSLEEEIKKCLKRMAKKAG
jgi:thioredoxin-like negative regulator of GroEL